MTLVCSCPIKANTYDRKGGSADAKCSWENQVHYFSSNLHFQRVDIWVFLVSFIVLMAYWYFKEYRINKA